MLEIRFCIHLFKVCFLGSSSQENNLFRFKLNQVQWLKKDTPAHEPFTLLISAEKRGQTDKQTLFIPQGTQLTYKKE